MSVVEKRMLPQFQYLRLHCESVIKNVQFHESHTPIHLYIVILTCMHIHVLKYM